MPTLSLNRQVVGSRLTNIRNCLIEMRTLGELPKEEFLSDVRNWAACETFLRHALEDIFDIGRHILARIGGFEMGLEYKSKSVHCFTDFQGAHAPVADFGAPPALTEILLPLR